MQVVDNNAFFSSNVAHSEHHDQWPASTIRLRCFVTSEYPPDHLITSIRAVVAQPEGVLILSNRDEIHILPGGRREIGETYVQTLVREVQEETGWTVHVRELLGVRHFHHLTPRPAGHTFPYPDFFQLIYLTDPITYDPTHQDTDDYEENATFQTWDEAEELKLAPDQVVFLRASRTRFARLP